MMLPYTQVIYNCQLLLYVINYKGTYIMIIYKAVPERTMVEDKYTFIQEKQHWPGQWLIKPSPNITSVFKFYLWQFTAWLLPNTPVSFISTTVSS